MADEINIKVNTDASDAISDFNALNKATEKQVKSSQELQKQLIQLQKARQMANDPKQIDIINRKIKQTETELKKVNAETKKTETGFSRIRRAATALAAAFAAFRGAEFLTDATRGFAEFQQAAEATEAQFGQSADTILAELQRVSAGTISNYDLITSANKALALGVTQDLGQISKLLEIARVRGRSLGVDLTSAFNDIVTGIGRGSPLILDNLGIITKGWQEQAGAAGVAFDKQFILNKVIEDGNAILEKTGPLILTPAERFQRLSATAENAKNSIGEALLPALEALLDIVTPVIQAFTRLPSFLRAGTTALAAMVPVVIALTTALGPIGLTIGLVAAAITALGFAAASSKNQVLSLAQAQERLAEVDEKILMREEQLLNLQGKRSRALPSITRALRELRAEREELVKVIEEEEQKQRDLQKALEDQLKASQRAASEDKSRLNAFIVNKQAELNTVEQVEAEKAALIAQFADERVAIEESAALRIAEIRKRNAQLVSREIINQSQNLFNALGGFSDNRIAEIENEKEAALASAEAQGASREQLAATEAKFDAELLEAKRKQAKFDKANALFQIATSTAVGLARIAALILPTPAKIALGALLTGTSAAQAAAVAAQPLPGFRQGTDSAPEGLAVVGEDGPEIVRFRGGEQVIPNSRIPDNITTNNDNSNITNNINIGARDPFDLVNRLKREFGIRSFQ